MQNEEKEGNTLVSQCALDIGVGSIHDPPEVPGLTKLVNFILSQCGSEKYPSTSDTESLLKKYDSVIECQTMPMSSRFFFEMKNEVFLSMVFEEALDRFAH